MQALPYLIGVTLGVQGQQAGENIVTDGIRPAIAPRQFTAAGDGAVGLQLAQEI